MKTSIMKLTGLICLLALTFCPAGVWAVEEEKPTASADVGVFSKYVWRGYELSDDSVVIQPSSTVGYRGFSLNLWGNLDTDFDGVTDDDSEFNEIDMTLSYDKSFGPVGLGVGYIYYGLDGIDDAEEVYLSVGLDVFLSPTLTVYREIADLQGWYFNLGISHSFSLPKEITLDLTGSVGYYFSKDDGFVEVDSNMNPTNEKYRNFHDGLISVGLTIPFGKYFSFCPMIAYSFPLSDKADDLITAGSFSNDSDFFYGGATLSISF
ncbi:MAG: hypothetical protein JRF53_11830 [Deltaproteobacteria bacterium]|nr:hypothetical protein [Deltaproteobacteria bacterium]MBW2344683.1 hypothetical protein [Deltaproteobacteria bacterium]